MMCGGRKATRALALGLMVVVGCASEVPSNRDESDMFTDGAVATQDAAAPVTDGEVKAVPDASESTPDASLPDPDPVIELARVVGTASSLNIRSGPSTNDKVVGSVPEGCVVTILGETSGAWRKVEYKGTVGWCHGDYLNDVQPDAVECAS